MIEMLIVVGIIGVISLIAVPSFMSMRRAMQVKSSVRQLTSDIRSTRQRAVTKHEKSKLSFTTGVGATGYVIWEHDGLDAGGNDQWKPLQFRQLDQVSFYSTNFTDVDTPADGKKDIVFRMNGSLDQPTGFPYEFVVRTDWDIPENEYKIVVGAAGNLKAIASHYE